MEVLIDDRPDDPLEAWEALPRDAGRSVRSAVRSFGPETAERLAGLIGLSRK